MHPHVTESSLDIEKDEVGGYMLSGKEGLKGLSERGSNRTVHRG